MSAIDLLAVAASSTDSDGTEKEFDESPTSPTPAITIEIPDHGKQWRGWLILQCFSVCRVPNASYVHI